MTFHQGGPFAIDDYAEESVFRPENLVQAALRQKGLPKQDVPEICILDPDGDIVRYLMREGKAVRSSTWPCYHTDLYLFHRGGMEFGIIGCAVGAPYAVLIAEELGALGCRLILSVTSAGLLDTSIRTPCFMLIEAALRDEGTSYRYLPSAASVALNRRLRCRLEPLIQQGKLIRGRAWTTDAPFRETQSRIDAMRQLGAVAVEMESAALYAFAQARRRDVVCLAHITNQMATREDDFDKGEADGSEEALDLLVAATRLINSEVSR